MKHVIFKHRLKNLVICRNGCIVVCRLILDKFKRLRQQQLLSVFLFSAYVRLQQPRQNERKTKHGAESLSRLQIPHLLVSLAKPKVVLPGLNRRKIDNFFNLGSSNGWRFVVGVSRNQLWHGDQNSPSICYLFRVLQQWRARYMHAATFFLSVAKLFWHANTLHCEEGGVHFEAYLCFKRQNHNTAIEMRRSRVCESSPRLERDICTPHSFFRLQNYFGMQTHCTEEGGAHFEAYLCFKRQNHNTAIEMKRSRVFRVCESSPRLERFIVLLLHSVHSELFAKLFRRCNQSSSVR